MKVSLTVFLLPWSVSALYIFVVRVPLLSHILLVMGRAVSGRLAGEHHSFLISRRRAACMRKSFTFPFIRWLPKKLFLRGVLLTTPSCQPKAPFHLNNGVISILTFDCYSKYPQFQTQCVNCVFWFSTQFIQMWYFENKICQNLQDVFVNGRLLYCSCYQIIESKKEFR